MTPPTDTDPLISDKRERSGTHIEEYGSIAVAVIENEEHQPMVVHDFGGPVFLEPGTLERRDSLVETLSLVLDEESLVTELPEQEPEDVGGQTTILAEVASMAKNLIGCGVLSLPAGISLCANTPSGLYAANFWILIMGAIFGFFCYLIAKVCDMTGRTTYRGIWQETIGHKGSMFVSIANALKAAMADLAYATILSQTLNSLFASVGLQVSRVTCLLLITVVAILPLCLLKNLQVLAPFSVLGTAGIILTTLAMAVRYWDGSYLPGGRYYDDIDRMYQPSFGTDNHSWTPRIFPFICMVYEAYVMHYNSARFYTELKDRSLFRFGIAVGASFALAAVLYIVITSTGFLTFGANSNGYILNNYSPYDPLATVSRICVGLSTLMAYPIVFMGVRDGVLDIFEVSIYEQTSENLNRMTLVLLAILTLVAVFVTDLGLVNALGGGLVATAIVFVFPTIMYRAAMKLVGGGLQLEANLASGLTVLGVFFGIVGAWLAVTGTSSA